MGSDQSATRILTNTLAVDSRSLPEKSTNLARPQVKTSPLIWSMGSSGEVVDERPGVQGSRPDLLEQLSQGLGVGNQLVLQDRDPATAVSVRMLLQPAELFTPVDVEHRTLLHGGNSISLLHDHGLAHPHPLHSMPMVPRTDIPPYPNRDFKLCSRFNAAKDRKSVV